MTNNQDHLLHLWEVLGQLQESAAHLAVSIERCQTIDREAADEDSLVEFEALTSRFARLTDILIHKTYRTIDSVEFIDGGTLIDVLNRAEKRGLIGSTQQMRIFKDLRNDIAHEYLLIRLKLIHEEVLQLAPKLLLLIDKVIVYCQRYRSGN